MKVESKQLLTISDVSGVTTWLTETRFVHDGNHNVRRLTDSSQVVTDGSEDVRRPQIVFTRSRRRGKSSHKTKPQHWESRIRQEYEFWVLSPRNFRRVGIVSDTRSGTTARPGLTKQKWFPSTSLGFISVH